MRHAFLCLTSAAFAVGISGCVVLGNEYNSQYQIACADVDEAALRMELWSVARKISQTVEQPVTQIADEPGFLVLNIHVPDPAPPSFRYGGSPVNVRMSVTDGVNGPRLFIAVFKTNDTGEDENVLAVRRTVETAVANSRCRIDDVWLNRFNSV